MALSDFFFDIMGRRWADFQIFPVSPPFTQFCECFGTGYAYRERLRQFEQVGIAFTPISYVSDQFAKNAENLEKEFFVFTLTCGFEV